MSADYRRIAAHALLPGLSHAVEIALAALNEARGEIGLAALRIEGSEQLGARKRGRPKGSKNNAAAHTASATSATAKGMTSAERWRVVKEAGIKTAHAPTAKDVERALKLLAKRDAAAPKVMTAAG